MPKELTHWTLAEKAFQRIPEHYRMKAVIKEHRHLYLIGALLPDVAFGYIIGPGRKKVDRLVRNLHNPTGSSFEPLVRILEYYHPSKIPDFIWALVAGISAHFMADIVFHPMVHYFAGNDNSAKTEGRHSTIETALDLHYLGTVDLKNQGLFKRSVSGMKISFTQLAELLAVFLGMEPKKHIGLMKRVLRLYSAIQWSFSQQWFFRLFKTVNRTLRINADHKLTYYYPVYRQFRFDFFDNPINYKDPVSGKEQSKRLEEFEEEFLSKMKFIDALEKNLNSKAGPDYSAFADQPNLLTGLFGVPSGNMKFFDTAYDLSRLEDVSRHRE